MLEVDADVRKVLDLFSPIKLNLTGGDRNVEASSWLPPTIILAVVLPRSGVGASLASCKWLCRH